jgi:hypothetical protein
MMPDNVCANCQQSFATNEQIVNADGHIWHTKCFVCAQCFQPFENGLYFEVIELIIFGRMNFFFLLYFKA